MNRLNSFLLGILLGGALVFCGLKYHVVRAGDGFHRIPKQTAEFSDVYVDIRQFDVADWNEHRELATALIQSDKAYLLQDAAKQTLQESLDGALDALKKKE